LLFLLAQYVLHSAFQTVEDVEAENKRKAELEEARAAAVERAAAAAAARNAKTPASH